MPLSKARGRWQPIEAVGELGRTCTQSQTLFPIWVWPNDPRDRQMQASAARNVSGVREAAE